MNSYNESSLIERFLWGRQSPDELQDFFRRIGNNQEFYDQVAKECAYEAMFYEQTWGLQDEGISRDDRDELIIEKSMGPMMSSQSQDQISVGDWNSAFNDAWETVRNLRAVHRPSRLFGFPKVARYLAAACFIAALGLSAFFYTAHYERNAAGYFASTTEVTDKLSQEIVLTQRPVDTPRSSFVFDSIVIYRSPDFSRKTIPAIRQNTIVEFNDKTAILIDKNAALIVTSQTDTAIAINLLEGSALFTVEKHRYRSFSISTPGSEIVVTGTIFRMTVNRDTTIVSVLEGSVLARGKNDSGSVSVVAGTSARIFPGAVVVENRDDAALLIRRSNLLHDFLMENGVFVNGQFVRSGLNFECDSVSSSKKGGNAALPESRKDSANYHQ